jgi:hypothetical protein
MQFTILALFAAASLVAATPVPEIGSYPVVVTNVGVANPGLQTRAKSKAYTPAPLRVGSNDAFQSNSCNGATSIYRSSDHLLTSVTAAERQCCQCASAAFAFACDRSLTLLSSPPTQ